METYRFYCVFCHQDLDRDLLYSHNPKCYHKWCKEKLQIDPICVCDDCKGMKVHTVLAKRSNAEPEAEISPTKVAKLAGKLNEAKGKVCYECGGKARASKTVGLEDIHLGKFRLYNLCKKEHVTNEEEAQKLAERLDEVLKEIKANGDSPTSSIRTSGEVEMDHEETESCAGFKSDVNSDTANWTIECGAACTKLMWITDRGKSQYFCKGSHLVRYFIKYFCAHQGGGGKKQGRTKKK
jgi:hypothetical protein